MESWLRALCIGICIDGSGIWVGEERGEKEKGEVRGGCSKGFDTVNENREVIRRGVFICFSSSSSLGYNI